MWTLRLLNNPSGVTLGQKSVPSGIFWLNSLQNKGTLFESVAFAFSRRSLKYVVDPDFTNTLLTLLIIWTTGLYGGPVVMFVYK